MDLNPICMKNINSIQFANAFIVIIWWDQRGSPYLHFYFNTLTAMSDYMSDTKTCHSAMPDYMFDKILKI